MNHRLPTYFISHGGGPWPYMDGAFRRRFAELERSLTLMRQELVDKPRAVLVVSGHWEEDGFAVSSAENPDMVYDYSGFPDPLYQVKYRAPGSPELATRVHGLISAGGLQVRMDPSRGYDHGTFSIMKPLYPEETIPVVQLSINRTYDPAQHLQLGRLLAPLRTEGVLIVGSGLSYHNLRLFDRNGAEPSQLFDNWLQQTLVNSDPADRTTMLINWSDAPFARVAHPREDHLIPLMVALGAAEQEAGATTYHQPDFMDNITASSFRFGEPPAPTA